MTVTIKIQNQYIRHHFYDGGNFLSINRYYESLRTLYPLFEINNAHHIPHWHVLEPILANST